jgi:hypothetical protein
LNRVLTTVDEVKKAVEEVFDKDWLFTVIETGGWVNEDRYGSLKIEFKNKSRITISPRRNGVRMSVHCSWMRGWTISGQMRFNPRLSTVKYAVSAIRSETVVEDFDLLKV